MAGPLHPARNVVPACTVRLEDATGWYGNGGASDHGATIFSAVRLSGMVASAHHAAARSDHVLHSRPGSPRSLGLRAGRRAEVWPESHSGWRTARSPPVGTARRVRRLRGQCGPRHDYTPYRANRSQRPPGLMQRIAGLGLELIHVRGAAPPPAEWPGATSAPRRSMHRQPCSRRPCRDSGLLANPICGIPLKGGCRWLLFGAS